MKDLLDALHNATNVKLLLYDNENKSWIIIYKNDNNPDLIDEENIIDFLTNA